MAAKILVLFVLLYVETSLATLQASPDAKKIENLEKQVQILSNLVQAQSSIMAKFSCQAQSGTGTSSTSECIVKIANQTKTIQKLARELRALEGLSKSQGSQIKQLQSSVKLAGTWPSGKYCILSSGGSCPPGFTRSSGFMRALSLYSGSGSYINQGTFGDSKIKCHGNCGQYGHWTGELYITACCK